jgi:hypothetical protein
VDEKTQGMMNFNAETLHLPVNYRYIRDITSIDNLTALNICLATSEACKNLHMFKNLMHFSIQGYSNESKNK